MTAALVGLLDRVLAETPDAIAIVEERRRRWLNVERQAVASCHDYARGHAVGKRMAADEILALLQALIAKEAKP